MKKIICFFLLILALNLSAFAQALLPTSWDFSTAQTPGPYPTGWTPSGTDFYTTSGNPGIACKFLLTGNTLIINFTTTPGNITYDLKANTANSAAYTSTFLVEESANGTTWTILHSHANLSITAFTSFTDTPLNNSRYIRFNLLVKASGNIALDNVTIAAAAAGPAQQINIKQGTTAVLNGGIYILSSAVSTITPTTFTVQNLGTVNTLNITSATISGTNASDFNVSSSPSTVAALSSGNLVVDFTPAAAGTRNAVLTIANDDVNANPYIINLYGIGGSYATEPTAQATNLTFSNVKSYTLSASFSAASPAPEGYIILRKKGSAITDIPADGSVYKRGDMIGSAKVVYSGTAISFTPNNIVASTGYYFAVFTYNGPGVYRNYLTPSPLMANVTSLGSMQPVGYYNGISTASTTFLADLHTKINPHTQLYYSNYGPAVINVFASRDTANNERVVTCVYSGQNKVYTEPFDWTTNGFSREHTYSHNWMPTNPAQLLPEYEDYHHLYPTNQNSANATRSNYPLGEVITASTTYLEGKLGLNAQGQTVYEPRESHKGDAARAIMYVATCYTTVGGNSWALRNPISSTIQYGQDQNILKKWNYQDPPDAWEIARNDFIESIQGNRNPFVDSLQYACYIDFTTMTKIAGPNVPCNAEVLGIRDNEKINDLVSLSPNPNNGNFAINYFSVTNKKVKIKIVDILGQILLANEINLTKGTNQMDMSIPNLKKGIYFLEFESDNNKHIEKVVIQ